MVQDYCVMTAVYGSRMSMISVYGFYRIITTTQYRVTSVKTRLWNSSGEIILGQALGCSLRTIVSHVRLALGLKHHIIGRMDFFDNSQSRKNHGINFNQFY